MFFRGGSENSDSVLDIDSEIESIVTKTPEPSPERNKEINLDVVFKDKVNLYLNLDVPKGFVLKELVVKKYEGKGIEVGESIKDMINKMRKYVIPPHHDFVTNNDVIPFVMYIFEFEHILDREDLSNIWQNLMPKIAQNPELDEVSITHPCGIAGEFFENGEFPNSVKWMVYKVKRKAEKNYFNVTTGSQDDPRFKFEFNFSP